MPTYARIPCAFTKGAGAWLWDDNNDKYLDALAGIAVCGLGHAHPGIATAIVKQANTLLHTSNLYRIPAQEKLGQRLCDITGMERVFFCNSGAEANETAIKLARVYGHNKNIDQPAVIVCENSFHGRTMATLSATGNTAAHNGFEPLLEGFIRVPFNDIPAIERACQQNKNICAVLIEPVQGEGGIHIPANDYLENLRTLCDQHQLLMMLDEVQSGNGRTGQWFAFQHTQAAPDVISTAKGLGNGMPIGACMAKGNAASLFAPGMHGSTFGGNPLACTVALKVLDIIEEEGILAHTQKISGLLAQTLKSKLSDITLVKEIRHQGLMIGIELSVPCKEVVMLAFQQKLLLNVTAGNVIRLLPPLIINEHEVEQIADRVFASIDAFATALPSEN